MAASLTFVSGISTWPNSRAADNKVSGAQSE